MCPLTTTINGAAAILKKSPAEIRALIDSGAIRWAINVAAPSSRRPEIRIPMSSILAAIDPSDQPDPSPESVARSLFGRLADLIPAPRFYLALGITHQHFYSLVQSGALSTTGTPRRGAGGCVLVPFSSAIQFLKTRRIS